MSAEVTRNASARQTKRAAGGKNERDDEANTTHTGQLEMLVGTTCERAGTALLSKSETTNQNSLSVADCKLREYFLVSRLQRTLCCKAHV